MSSIQRISPSSWIILRVLVNLFISVFATCIGMYAILIFKIVSEENISLTRENIILGLVIFVVVLVASFIKNKKTTVIDGNVGLIRVFGKKIRSYVSDEGDFHKIPFVIVDAISLEYDNLEVEYSNLQTSDGVAIKGYLTVEKDVCDIFKVQDVEKSTGLGVDGKIRHKSLELIKEAMDDVSVVGLLQEKDGSKKLYTALEREISKTSCFEAPKEPFLDTHSAKEGIHVFFSDTGMNLRFTVQVHTGQNKEINEAFDRISVEKANVKSQKLKAEGEAESLKIKKAAEAKVFKDAYIDYTTEDGEFGLTKSQAVYQANLLADYFDSETLVSLAGPDGKKLKGSIERLVALAKKITTE